MSYLFSYKDIPVYEHDVNFLNDRQWLNDICINLAFRIFEDDYGTSRNSVILMDPAAVSFLRLQVEDDDEYENMALSLRINDHDWIFMPVSDNESFDGASTHWSLLVCHRPSLTFFSLDSHSSYNLRSSKRLLPKIIKLFNVK